MNAERLHVIARAVKDDLATSAVVDNLQSLESALRNQGTSQDAAAQQALAAAIQLIQRNLTNAASNNFPPTWRQAIDEMEVSPLLGMTLLARVREILQANQMTPVVAADGIQTLHQDASRLTASIDQLLTQLDRFRIETETPPAGTAELGVLIPREAVDEELGQLAKEFLEIEQIVKPFQEIATNSFEPVKVARIASSDFGLFMVLDPQAVALIVGAVAGIVSTYANILKIKEYR